MTFEVGKTYRTKGGWVGRVEEVNGLGNLLVCHLSTGGFHLHYVDGTPFGLDGDEFKEFTLTGEELGFNITSQIIEPDYETRLRDQAALAAFAESDLRYDPEDTVDRAWRMTDLFMAERKKKDGSMILRYATVCSGIEAPSVAWHSLGWEPVFFSEIEKFPSNVLKHHYPNVPNLGDMTKFKTWRNYAIRLLCGGTPCQSFSVAGLRKGLDDARGNLMLTFAEMAARFRPDWIFWENVPGVLSSDGGRDFAAFLGLISGRKIHVPDGGWGKAGIIPGYKNAYGIAYRIFDAQYFGVAQRRRRVFVVGYIGDWRPAAAVLLERESLRGHPAPSREKKQAITGTIEASLGRSRGAGTPVAGALTARHDSSPCADRGQNIVASFGWNKSPSQTMRVDTETTDSLQASPSSNPAVICWDEELNARDELSETIVRGGDGGRHAGVMVENPVAFQQNQLGEIRTGEVMGTLNTNSNASGRNTPMLHHKSTVRRLTPQECERLQGFPDGYTDIRPKGKDTPDGPRYKALGNSMAVPVLRWIGERIGAVENIISDL